MSEVTTPVTAAEITAEATRILNKTHANGHQLGPKVADVVAAVITQANDFILAFGAEWVTPDKNPAREIFEGSTKTRTALQSAIREACPDEGTRLLIGNAIIAACEENAKNFDCTGTMTLPRRTNDDFPKDWRTLYEVSGGKLGGGLAA